MSHVESVELCHVSDWLQFVDLIVRDPELLQGLSCTLNTSQRFYQISAQRENLQILQDLEVLNVDNQVGGQRQLLTVDQDVKGALHLLYWRIDSDQFDLLSLGGFLPTRFFPFLQGCFDSRWHFDCCRVTGGETSFEYSIYKMY